MVNCTYSVIYPFISIFLPSLSTSFPYPLLPLPTSPFPFYSTNADAPRFTSSCHSLRSLPTLAPFLSSFQSVVFSAFPTVKIIEMLICLSETCVDFYLIFLTSVTARFYQTE